MGFFDAIEQKLQQGRDLHRGVQDAYGHFVEGTSHARNMIQSDNLVDGVEHASRWLASGARAARAATPVVEAGVKVARTGWKLWKSRRG